MVSARSLELERVGNQKESKGYPCLASAGIQMISSGLLVCWIRDKVCCVETESLGDTRKVRTRSGASTLFGFRNNHDCFRPALNPNCELRSSNSVSCP